MQRTNKTYIPVENIMSVGQYADAAEIRGLTIRIPEKVYDEFREDAPYGMVERKKGIFLFDRDLPLVEAFRIANEVANKSHKDLLKLAPNFRPSVSQLRRLIRESAWVQEEHVERAG